MTHEISELFVNIAFLIAWIAFGSLIYKKCPQTWNHAGKLALAIVVPLVGLTVLSMLLGIDF
jgi:hypothetical protein